MAGLTAGSNIRKRIHQPGVRRGFIHRLVVPSMAKVTKIAEGMLAVPVGTVIIDRILTLGFMTIFA